MRCATHRKSIRGDKNLILFVIHLFDEAYKRTSCVQDRALRRPLERREAGMMDGGAVNKMKRPESCLPLFGRHPLRDQRDILSSLSRRRHHHNHRRYQLLILSQHPRADHLVQLASRSRQGHPLRDRLNTSRLLYEILPTDLREGPQPRIPVQIGWIICDRYDRATIRSLSHHVCLVSAGETRIWALNTLIISNLVCLYIIRLF